MQPGQESVDLNQLADVLYEDLNGYIYSVEYVSGNSNALLIRFRCDNWRYDEQNQYSVRDEYDSSPRYFTIHCSGVVESDIQPSSSGELQFTEQHPLLWDYTEPRGGLYYSATTQASAYEILGRLSDAHSQVLHGWRPVKHYTNGYRRQNKLVLGTDGSGQLAQGPKPLMDIYQQALEGILDTYFVPATTPKEDVKALIFDEGFVICRHAFLIEGQKKQDSQDE